MPQQSLYFRTEWYTRIHITSTLAKASPPHCTMVYGPENLPGNSLAGLYGIARTKVT